ncbi:hypothetical protein SARC_04639 [Sphaeroforma arctica JP610]|uniref:MYND-type domain-containing protein n=1 Tax=Sphaeroforma arctica JP610 TaxID=667725 RepID=A0A0L0G2S1_9EUKA|nr:hypothetical protein SARC_04639 [Sphaeroforma arctica JP610]KNC83101.1 hypothetical protein SARC_04639 [Sphaeroforma arctica JP610]|eukprot:XP_014157003.1 hypothetical protein SARC_04639 [Sphaeroforma arctica JP610]
MEYTDAEWKRLKDANRDLSILSGGEASLFHGSTVCERSRATTSTDRSSAKSGETDTGGSDNNRTNILKVDRNKSTHAETTLTVTPRDYRSSQDETQEVNVSNGSRGSNSCAVCGNNDAKVCTQYRTIYYCGVKCQKQDRRRHKPDCKAKPQDKTYTESNNPEA